MAEETGFANAWTSGEIDRDAEDRVDIQPIAKGCRQAQNMLVTITGPLKKRRGFWDLGPAPLPRQVRMVPFRRSVDDALMLLFQHQLVTVYAANGAPTGVSFVSPYLEGDLPNLRWRQVADVIYFRTADGQPPHTLTHNADGSWTFALETFTNGPWLPENTTPTTITVAKVTGTALRDANPYIGASMVPPQTPAGAIEKGATVNLTSSAALFTPNMVGDNFRVRATTGSASIRSWIAGTYTPVGWFILSVGNIYIATATAGDAGKSGASTPPVQTIGLQSDGCNQYAFLHDGAGIIEITAVTDSTHAAGTVLSTLPIGDGDATSYWAKSAYGNSNGWPRAWPSIVEERLANGATSGNLDQLDLTRIAGFAPTTEDYHPGLGTGTVLDTDAIRRRAGTDGAEIHTTFLATFLIVFSASAEYVCSGGLFGEPITPSSVVVREVSDFGSEPILPVKAHKGAVWVTRGGQTLRRMTLDLQQQSVPQDLTFLVQHLADQGFAELAWLPDPDDTLWARFKNGTVAALTLHDEQQVRGWTSQYIPGGFTVENIASIPGPSRLETLWMVVSRVKNGVVDRRIWQQSQRRDALFIDGAQEYAGPPVDVIGGLANYAGETARVLANWEQIPDQVVSNAGTIAVPAGTTIAYVGLGFPVAFESLQLRARELGARERLAAAIVHVETSGCNVGFYDADEALAPPDDALERVQEQIPGEPALRKLYKDVTIPADSVRDPRIVIYEDSASDFTIFSILPRVEPGG